MKVNDATAFYTFGTAYLNGDNKMEVSRDQEKGLPFLLRAGELGSAKSYHQLAYAYMKGYGVEKDEKKTRHYFELAAIGGNVGSRHNLGVFEELAGNTIGKAIKHYSRLPLDLEVFSR
jgi:TPR repeat protein